jgi:hypothetical protein
MEYLTLRDIPHRQYNPAHPSTMARPYSRDGLLGSIPAAVSPPSRFDPPGALEELRLPSTYHTPSYPVYPPGGFSEYPFPILPPLQPYHSYSREPYPPFMPRRREHSRSRSPRLDRDSTSRPLNSIERELLYKADQPLIKIQHHHLRDSPPLQANEQITKLPSFSEVWNSVGLANVHPDSPKLLQTSGTERETTPPRTPRRNGSLECSPYVKSRYEEPSWEYKRKNDSLGAIYASQPGPPEHLPVQSRHMSAIDPALYTQPSPPHASRGYSTDENAYHRPSVSYAPPPAPIVANPYRHRSPAREMPPAYNQSRYSDYPPQAAPSHPAYDRRPSYYAEPPVATHAYPYDRAHDSYYSRPPVYAHPHQGYEQHRGYGEVRFHHSHVPDHGLGRKRRGNLPREATLILKEWFMKNRSAPYPTEEQKIDFVRRTELSMSQVRCHFLHPVVDLLATSATLVSCS